MNKISNVARKGKLGKKNKLSSIFNSHVAESDNSEGDDHQSNTSDEDLANEKSVVEHSSIGKDSSDDDSDEEADVREALRKRLLTMKPEKVVELKKKLGEELFKKTFSIADSVNNDKSKSQQRKKNKNNKRPREMSSKQPVSAFRRVVTVSKPKSYDPRFMEDAGEFDDVSFRRDYAFIDDLRVKEIQELRLAHREAVKAGTPAWKTERMKTNLLRLENQQRAADAARLKIDINAEVRSENIERMNRGERPIYFNTQQMREQFLTKKSLQEKKRKREIRKGAALRNMPSRDIIEQAGAEKKPRLDLTKLS